MSSYIQTRNRIRRPGSATGSYISNRNRFRLTFDASSASYIQTRGKLRSAGSLSSATSGLLDFSSSTASGLLLVIGMI